MGSQPENTTCVGFFRLLISLLKLAPFKTLFSKAAGRFSLRQAQGSFFLVRCRGWPRRYQSGWVQSELRYGHDSRHAQNAGPFCVQTARRVVCTNYILISTSTPAGKFRLMRASIVRSVGFKISIKRL